MQIGSITWYNNGQVVKTVTSSFGFSPATVVAGGNGNGPAADQLSLPVQVYVDGSGRLDVADQINKRIQQFSPGSTSATNGTTLIGFAGTGTADVVGLYGDGQGNLFTEKSLGGNNGAGIIQKWTPGATSGVQVATVTPDANGVTLLGKIFVDHADDVYVVEPANNRVQKWEPGATSGMTVAGGNGPGSAANQLSNPGGVFVDASGNIYVADVDNSRIQKWAPGASTGVTVAGGNGIGAAANQFFYPLSVVVDDAGGLYVADSRNQRIQYWPAGATSGITVAGGNGLGSAVDQLYDPEDIFLDNQGFLYISDSYNNRILKLLEQTGYVIDTTLIADQPGVYTATVTTTDGCTGNSNAITVRQSVHPAMQLGISPVPVCAGDTVLATAEADTTGLNLSYAWQVNGASAGDGGARYVDVSPANGDRIGCIATDTSACAMATANTVSLTVNAVPIIQPGELFSMPYGGSVTLEPVIDGTVNSYAWTPASGLSDTTIRDPVATPASTTDYTLTLYAPDGCKAGGVVKVDVYTPLSIPNAFTPNGDGTNDIFYVLSGPPGTIIASMQVFDRWGQRVFGVHDIPPGDRAYGWNGNIAGRPAAAGTYVYLIAVRLPNGSPEVFKGTVEMVR